jgi:hypothetical protein
VDAAPGPELVAVDDAATVDQGGSVLIDVLANDTGTGLTLDSVQVLSGSGTAVIEGGKVRFISLATAWAPVSLEYRVSNGTDATDTALVAVTIVRDITAPGVTVPVVTAVSSVRTNATFDVTWSGSDHEPGPVTGIDHYELWISRDGHAFTLLYSGADAHRLVTLPIGHAFAFRVRAVDVAGNIGSWATGPRLGLTAYQSASSGIRYLKRWTGVDSSRSSGTGYHYASVKGASASLSFQGSYVAFAAILNHRSGWAKVYLDGRYVARVNLYSAVSREGQVVFSRWVAAGRHSIKVVSETTRRVNVDAFLVLR